MTTICKFATLAAAAAMLTLAAACAPTELTIGAKPNTDALDRLRLGQTTEAEIARIVGPPRGRGEALFAIDAVPRKLMYYEFVHMRGSVGNLKILAILLKDGRYDGHYWFSSTEILNPDTL